MKTTILLLTLLLTTFGAIAQTYQVMTYNIRYNNKSDGENAWPNRKDKVASIMQRADIIGVQEALHGMIDDLTQLMTDYGWIGVGRDNAKTKGEYAPIFYRKDKFHLVHVNYFWLSESGAPGSKGWDAANTRICTMALLHDYATQKEFYVVNTHFDNKGIEARKESAKLIIARIKNLTDGLPVIVTGDLNTTETDEGYTTIVNSGMIDAAHSAIKKAGPPYSFCGFKVANTKCEKIDYIFINALWTANTHTVIDEHDGEYYPSDHLPILAELQLR